jgi:hypothetical protein
MPTCIFRGVRYVLFHSDHNITRRGFQYCDQNGTVHTWHPWICKLESPSCDTVIRMEQYIPDTTAYVSWNPLLVILWSEWNHSITRREFQLTYAGVSDMYCSILITISPEEDSNLHMQWCQVCTWYCDQNGTVHTWHHCICKLESSSCDTVIRMEQYIPDTPEYASWHPLLLLLWSEWNSTNLILESPSWTYICRGVRYVLFHSDHSITRRGF